MSGKLKSSASSIKRHLNQLMTKDIEKRHEQIFKFILQRILRHIHKTQLLSPYDKLADLYDKYFKDDMTRATFDSYFMIKKKSDNKQIHNPIEERQQSSYSDDTDKREVQRGSREIHRVRPP